LSLCLCLCLCLSRCSVRGVVVECLALGCGS
jgi:hypothetical protein